MTIWYDSKVTACKINEHCKNTLVSHMKISIDAITKDTLIGSMPVSNEVKQPFGIVHGGANCVIAETLGSLAANLVLDSKKEHAVGLSITTNHIKAVRNGVIKAIAQAKHLGKKTHVWEIETFNNSGDLTSSTTLTMAVIQKLN
ncbi:MAG: hotdog fold thioesterase [Bacteriovoracaceae bacterium]|jgi:1,4-dihydroxy-2-naphthoyl-CoA hydrolase|nr:hotdog fold thioesterase [Bacteriovoracaceae bacterium]